MYFCLVSPHISSCTLYLLHIMMAIYTLLKYTLQNVFVIGQGQCEDIILNMQT